MIQVIFRTHAVDKAICKYKFHRSIIFIKSTLENQKLFSFQRISKFDT